MKRVEKIEANRLAIKNKKERFWNMGENFKYLIKMENQDIRIEDARETNEMLGRIILLEKAICCLSLFCFIFSIICVRFPSI